MGSRNLRESNAIARGLGHIRTSDAGRPVKIGNRARHPQDAVIAARGEAEFLGDLEEKLAPLGIRRCHLFKHRAFDIRVGGDALGLPKAPPLNSLRLGQPRCDRGRVVARGGRSRSVKATGGTSIQRSKWSISGPEIRPR